MTAGFCELVLNDGVFPVKDDSTFGFEPQHLANLLDLSINQDSSQNEGPPEEMASYKADLLTKQLSANLPMDSALAQALPGVLQRVCQELEPLTTGTILKVLCDATVEFGVIDRLKGHAKKLTKLAGSESDREVAVVIYYAAIAHALVYSDKKITTRAHDSLRAAFDKLSATAWVNSDLVSLFSQASSLCEEKMRTK